MSPFGCSKPDRLNTTLVLRSTKACYQVLLALTQRLAGDTAGAKLTAEQARKTLEPVYGNQPDSTFVATMLSLAYAGMGEKDSALKLAERAIMLSPRAKDAGNGPGLEENLALIQAMFGENSRAISTLTSCYKRPMAAFSQCPLRRPFLGSIRSGTLCAAIPLSKNSARKSSREPARFRSTVDSNGRTIWIADAHRGDGKRFIVRADEKLTAFLELVAATRSTGAAAGWVVS